MPCASCGRKYPGAQPQTQEQREAARAKKVSEQAALAERLRASAPRVVPAPPVPITGGAPRGYVPVVGGGPGYPEKYLHDKGKK